jgi:hypothetical protein
MQSSIYRSNVIHTKIPQQKAGRLKYNRLEELKEENEFEKKIWVRDFYL